VLVLAVDTSTPIGSIALVEDGEVRAELAARVSAKHGETLLPNVARVLEQAGVSMAEIGLLAVGLGPGSFTGLRIALATMKGLALARQTPLVGVSSLFVLARGVGIGDRVVVPLVDAHKQEVFGAAYGEDAQGAIQTIVAPFHALPGSAADHLIAALAKETRSIVLLGDAPAALRDPIAAAMERAGHPVVAAPEAADFPRAAVLAAEADRLYLTRGADDLGALRPLYVRAPDITMPATPPAR
jgi:tRNA threonylcarbamoyladenosine biosynthesis protein TsaB